MQECASVSTGLGRGCRTFSSLKSPELMPPDGFEKEVWVSAGAEWGLPLVPPSILSHVWGSVTSQGQTHGQRSEKTVPKAQNFTAFLVIKKPKIK